MQTLFLVQKVNKEYNVYNINIKHLFSYANVWNDKMKFVYKTQIRKILFSKVPCLPCVPKKPKIALFT